MQNYQKKKKKKKKSVEMHGVCWGERGDPGGGEETKLFPWVVSFKKKFLVLKIYRKGVQIKNFKRQKQKQKQKKELFRKRRKNNKK